MEAALINKSDVWTGKVASSANDEPNVGHENCTSESSLTNDDNMIGRELKSTVKDRIQNELSTMIEELLDDILRQLLQTRQRGIGSVVYIVVWLVVLDLLDNGVIKDTSNAHIEKLLDTNGAANRLWKSLFT